MIKIRMSESLELSRIVSGFWRMADREFSKQDVNNLINEFIEAGVTSFDHADIYGDYSCEQIFGEAAALSQGLRDKIQLVTKCGIRLVSKNRPENKIKYYDTGKNHITASVENSLRNLQTDYIDLLLIHRPDPFMNPEDTAAAFSRLKKEGKVLNFGVSNFMPQQLNMLSSYLEFPLVTNQIEISPFNLEHFEAGTIDHCMEKRIYPMAWSPLGGGKLFTSDEEKVLRLRAVLKDIVTETGASSMEQIVFAWLLAHPAKIIPVVGTARISRLKSAVASLNIELSREQWFRILQAASGKEVD